MSMGNSGLFKGAVGATADEADAPIGFDETPPDPQETDVHAFPCYDHIPRTICPPQTNGGRIRAMDNHQMARFLVSINHTPAPWTEEQYFEWLNQPCVGAELDVP